MFQTHSESGPGNCKSKLNNNWAGRRLGPRARCNPSNRQVSWRSVQVIGSPDPCIPSSPEGLPQHLSTAFSRLDKMLLLCL